MSFLRSSVFIRIVNSPHWLFAESATLEKGCGWNFATFLWGWGNCIRECCVFGVIYWGFWYMYGRLARWYWLDNACYKNSTNLVIPKAIAIIDWFKFLVGWANYFVNSFCKLIWLTNHFFQISLELRIFSRFIEKYLVSIWSS